MTALFVTGTGTGVGKTWVGAALLREAARRDLPMWPLKPVLSGLGAPSWRQAAGLANRSAPAEPVELTDTSLLLLAAGWTVDVDSLERCTPFIFEAPLSPDMAAAREGVSIDATRVTAEVSKAMADNPAVLVEGAGGVMSPVGARDTFLDVIAANSGAPVVLCAGGYLGAISHTLSAARAITSVGARLVAVALVDVHAGADLPVPLAETASSIGQHLEPDAPPVFLIEHAPQIDEVRLPPGLVQLVLEATS